MPTAALNGKDLVLYIGNGASPEVFSKLAAVKTIKRDDARSTVDITNKDSSGYQEMLNTASIASIKLSVDAIRASAPTQAQMRTLFQTGATNNFKIVNGAGDQTVCGFIVTGISESGGYNDAETVSYTLESSGVPVLTPGS